jgi:hypothetical protein
VCAIYVLLELPSLCLTSATLTFSGADPNANWVNQHRVIRAGFPQSPARLG